MRGTLKSLFNSLSYLKKLLQILTKLVEPRIAFAQVENRLQSENRREIKKIILEIVKIFCRVRPAWASGHIASEPFAYPKLAEEREERGSEYKERSSAVNVGENVGTTILSTLIVQSFIDVNTDYVLRSSLSSREICYGTLL